MDKQDHSQPQVSGIVGGMPQLSYATNVYTGNPGQGSLVTSVVTSQPTGQTTGVQIGEQRAYQQIHQQQQQELEQQLQSFWGNQRQEIDRLTEFKNHSLPLARIKKIMKADEDVRMISAEAPIVFARACEMFILELTLRAWNHTEENKRRTLQKNDIAAAIARTDVFDFLVDIIPREDLKDEALLAVPRNAMPLGESSGSLPYYYMQPQQMAPARPPAPGLPVNTPAIDPTLYGQQPHPYIAPHLWSEVTAPQQPQSPSDS